MNEIRRALDRYAAHHGMSSYQARSMPVEALLNWIDADDARRERERLAAAREAANDATEDQDEHHG